METVVPAPPMTMGLLIVAPPMSGCSSVASAIEMPEVLPNGDATLNARVPALSVVGPV